MTLNDTPRDVRRSSRRRFLQSSATAAGAATLGSLGLTSGAHAAGDDTIRLGLIGCGERGTGAAIQAMNADRGVKIVALADVFADHVERCRGRLRQSKPDQTAVDDDHCFAGFDAYRKVIDSGVDGILIACSSRFHPDYLTAGVNAGKHVFVEKPHAIDPPGVHRVLAACEEARKRKLSVVSGLHRRYMPSIQQTIERVRDGAIGELITAEVSFMRAPYRVATRDPAWSEMEWQFRNWYHFRWLSGDDVPQSLIHTVDVASWAMNEAAPVTAHGMGGRSAFFGQGLGDVFDHHAVVYEFASGTRVYGFVRTQKGCHGEVEVKLFGSKGEAREGLIRGATNWRYEKRRQSGHQLAQTAFVSSIRNGQPLNNGDYMARSTMITLLGQMAVFTGKKIAWDEGLKAGFRYPPHDGKIDFGIESPVQPGADGRYPLPVPGETPLG